MVNILKGMKDDISFEDFINLSESIVQEVLNFNNETIEKPCWICLSTHCFLREQNMHCKKYKNITSDHIHQNGVNV